MNCDGQQQAQTKLVEPEHLLDPSPYDKIPPKKFPICENMSLYGSCGDTRMMSSKKPSTDRSATQPEGGSKCLLRSCPPITGDYHEHRPYDTLHESKKKASGHDAGKVETQS